MSIFLGYSSSGGAVTPYGPPFLLTVGLCMAVKCVASWPVFLKLGAGLGKLGLKLAGLQAPKLKPRTKPLGLAYLSKYLRYFGSVQGSVDTRSMSTRLMGIRLRPMERHTPPRVYMQDP